MITLGTLKNYVKHGVGSGNLSSLLDATSIVNQAGRHLHTMHPWKWTERPPVTVSFEADKNYVLLPQDFGPLVGYSMDDSLNDSFQFTTFSDLSMKRATSVVATSYYEAAIVRPGQRSKREAPPPPRIELWPTPGTTTEDALVLWYRGRWIELVDDEDVSDVPVEAEALLILIARAFAQGYETGQMQERVAEIARGPICDALKSDDGLLQPDYGRITNGAVGHLHGRGRLPWDTTDAPS